MVTLRIDAYITCVESILSNCFKEGSLVGHQMDLDSLVLK